MAALAVVSPLGWLLLAAAVGSWGCASAGRSSPSFAVPCWLFAIACPSPSGGPPERYLELAPEGRVGDPAAAQVHVTNEASTPLLPLGLVFPVGQMLAPFTLPLLAPRASLRGRVIPTQRRGVIPVGPVTTQRGDPFGVVRREVIWTQPLETVRPPRHRAAGAARRPACCATWRATPPTTSR